MTNCNIKCLTKEDAKRDKRKLYKKWQSLLHPDKWQRYFGPVEGLDKVISAIQHKVQKGMEKLKP